MEKVNVQENTKVLDCDKLFKKLKNDLIVKLSLTESAASEQAERISTIFKNTQAN